MFGLARRLHERGVIGINERNARFVLQYNRRKLYPLVDDKLRTKQLALENGIAVPELYGVVATHHDVGNFASIVATHRDFVIKPAHGTGGDGILVISGRSARKQGIYRLIDGTFMGDDDFRHHLGNIISGQYSLGGTRDEALIEYRVQSHPVFASVAFQGVPDVRVLVFKGYPAMAMVRLPTRRARGKANLHQGAMGVGVNLATGACTTAILGNDIISEHPDTGEPVAGLQIPQWQDLLLLASRCHDLTGLGYLGVDIVLDRNKGPLILELNARPGLNIQIANQAGLRTRFEKILALPETGTPEEKVALVRDLF